MVRDLFVLRAVENGDDFLLGSAWSWAEAVAEWEKLAEFARPTIRVYIQIM